MPELPEHRRRFKRQPVQMPVLLKGTDAAGRPFFDRTEVVSLDQRGARMRTRFQLRTGSELEVELANDNETKRVRVVWRGEEGSLYEGLVGVEFVNPNDSWNLEALRAQWGAREP